MAYADSGILSTTSYPLNGSWIHDVYNPENTARQFLFGSGERTKAVDTMGAQLMLVGRQFPMIEFGKQETASLSITVVIPSDEDHDDQVRTIREFIRLRSTYCYRDGRGELMFGTITGGTISDDPIGTTVSMTLEANNYVEGE